MNNIKIFLFYCLAGNKTRINKTRIIVTSSILFCLLLLSSSVFLSCSAFAQNDNLSANNSEQDKLIQGKADKIIYKLLFNDSNSKGQLVFESKVTKVETITVENPLRLVIDLYGTFKAKSTNHIISNSKFISSLRLGAHPDKIRFVIDIIENPANNLSFKLNNNDNSAVLEFNYSGSSAQTQNIISNPEVRKEDVTDSITAAETTPIIPEKIVTVVNTNTPTSTATISPTATFTASASPSPSIAASFTATITNSPTATRSPSVTATATYTKTPNPTKTVSFSPTPTATNSPTATRSPSVTATATYTNTPNPTKTVSFSPTPTATNSPTATNLPSPVATISISKISPANTAKIDMQQDLASPELASTNKTDITIPDNKISENEISENSRESESQEVISLSFDYQEPDHMPVVILNTRLRPSYKLVKKDDGTFNLSISECSVANKSLRLPQFPPQDFLGFRFIQVATKNSSCEILIGVDKGTRVAAFSRENNILIRSIGFASN